MAPPGTLKLRINSQILSCSSPSGTISNKGKVPLSPGQVGAALALHSCLHVYFNQTAWLSTTAEPMPSEASQDGCAGGQNCLLGESERSSLPPNQAPWCPHSKGLSSFHLPGAGGGNTFWTITSKLDKHFPASRSAALDVDANDHECAFNDACTHHILSLKVYKLFKGRNGWFLIHIYYLYLIWHLTLRNVI